MKKSYTRIYSNLKLALILCAAVFMSGCVCVCMKSTPEAVASSIPEAVAPEESVVTPVTPIEIETETLVDPPSELWIKWTVAKGEHLWGISGEEEVFNQSENWPLLYKSNLDQITDADLIYPGQVLKIPRDSSQDEIDAAIHHAKNRGAWAVGKIEPTDKKYLKDSP